MSRLIDADKLVKKVLERDGVLSLKVEDIKSICGIPIEEIIVDAEPIRHGHWEEYLFDWEWRVCSVCGKGECFLYHLEGGVKQINGRPYCPHCGAKMDEETEDE